MHPLGVFLIARRAMLALFLFAPIIRSYGAESVVEAKVGSVALRLPVPRGFFDVRHDAPLLHQFAVSSTPPLNRHLCFFATRADIDASAREQTPILNRYFSVQTYRKAEQADFSFADFLKVKQDILKNHSRRTKEALIGAQELILNRGGSIGRALGRDSISLQIGDAYSLGVFDEQDASISRLVLMKTQSVIDGKPEEIPVVYASTTAVVKRKLVYFYAYSQYTSDDDVLWVRAATLDWVAKLVIVN